LKTVILVFGLASAWSLHTAQAKVLNSGPSGFTVTHETTVKLAPREAYDAFLNIGAWWSKSHTFSGDATNMTIEAKVNGCWCEALPNGGFVKHMDVASAVPGESLVLRGGLGPLHFMAATGAMTVSFKPAGAGTKVTINYGVGGYDPGGFKSLAPAVDGVLGEQLAAFVARSGG
jgi:hypothetical protein